MSAREQIERLLRRCWGQTVASRMFQRWIWGLSALLFAWTIFLHLSLRAGWWQPTPAQVLRGTLVVFSAAFVWALLALRPKGFPRFLRSLEEKHGEIGLRAWQGIRGNGNASQVEHLFLLGLWRRLGELLQGESSSFSLPRIPRLLIGASAVGLLFLLLPWGGGTGAGIAPRPSSEPMLSESGVEPENEERTRLDESKTESSPSSPQRDPNRSDPPAPPDRRPKRGPERPVDPKFVPARESDGPRSWKETLLYDLPVPGEQGLPAAGSSSIASILEKWKKIAEETVRKERLDEEEARLVSRYFDKLRP